VNIPQAIEVFFSEFQFPSESKNTRRTYKTALIKFLEYSKTVNLLSKDLSTIDPSVVSLFGAWLIAQDLSEHTQNIYESALRRALNYWRIKGWIAFSSDIEKETRQAMRIKSKKRNFSGSSRVGRVPEDFGNRMAAVVDSLPLPDEKFRLQRLGLRRAQALVHLLRATGLRIGDVCRLTKSDLRNAKTRSGYFTLPMQKTGTLAHCFLGEEAIHAADRYLKERSDPSPWVFIQHGRTGKPRPGTPQFFRTAVKGYGSKISPKTAWEIIRGIGRQAYGRQTTQFISPHAFRHWHAQSLIQAGARLEDVQSVLGHANPVITKQIYAPEPDLSRISEKERIIQRVRPKEKNPPPVLDRGEGSDEQE
jgi:site-specific recombinase XerD